MHWWSPTHKVLLVVPLHKLHSPTLTPSSSRNNSHLETFQRNASQVILVLLCGYRVFTLTMTTVSLTVILLGTNSSKLSLWVLKRGAFSGCDFHCQGCLKELRRSYCSRVMATGWDWDLSDQFQNHWKVWHSYTHTCKYTYIITLFI